MRHVFRVLPWFVIVLSGFAAAANAQEPVPQAPPPPAEEQSSAVPSAAARELIEHEQQRAAVDGILDDTMARRIGPLAAVERLVRLGPPVIPFMEAELTVAGTPHFNIACLVLGRVKTAESVGVLRAAAEAANRDTNELRRKRKLWSCYGLAMLGESDAVDLLDAGETKASDIELFDRMSGLEAAAVLTAPASIPRLFAQLDRYATTPGTTREVARILDALGRIADPSALPRILPYLKNADAGVRAAAARASGKLGDLAAVDAVVEALADPDENVRLDAAGALEDLLPSGKSAAITARLDVETGAWIRASLYRTLAATGGEPAIEVLRRYGGRPEYIDRLWLATAVGRIGNPKGLPFLRAALRDPDMAVAIHAADAIGEIGGAGATETLLAVMADRRWPLVQATLGRLVAQTERRAAPRAADRLLGDYLKGPFSDLGRFPDVYILGDAMVSLGYADRLPELREATKLQSDRTLVLYLEGLIRKLSVIQENQSDVPKWVATASSEDAGLRRLAYLRLGQIGGDPAAKALIELFSKASGDDAIELLRALGSTGSRSAAPVVERVLVDDAFDPIDKQRLRSVAAHAARKLGGPSMIDALRRSAERREGQDIDVLTYLAVAAGKDALKTLDAVRIPRLRYFSIKRGREQVRLDTMILALRAGRPLESLDATPEEIKID